MEYEKAECNKLPRYLQQLGDYLTQYQRFEHGDAMQHADAWRSVLNRPLPEDGIGIERLIAEMGEVLIPNGSQVSNPGFTSYITTGATTSAVLASLASAVASPQRIGLTAFNFLEELSLDWLAQMFELPAYMKGVYSSGGSVANLVALGAARQWAFEQLNIDPALDGFSKACRIYATAATHHTVQRAAAVLGMGRRAIQIVESDANGRMIPDALIARINSAKHEQLVNVAVVANAGTTSTGAIDPLQEIANIAKENNIWFHVDGAYGLPGILDPRVRPLYEGLALADSVIVDPHKWLGAPVGIGATFVRDRSILNRAFTQEASDYLEGSLSDTQVRHSMDALGIPYYDFGVELSAPARGVVVWALLREIGKNGLRDRVCRHNSMARLIAETARAHPNLEVVQEPTLSICCFRYIDEQCSDLNALNKAIHRQLVHNGKNLPSTAVVNNKLVIRPCFIGARTTWEHAHNLLQEVIEIGKQLAKEQCNGNAQAHLANHNQNLST